MKATHLLIVLNILLFNVGVVAFVNKSKPKPVVVERVEAAPTPKVPEQQPIVPEAEVKPKISFTVPNGDMKFPEIVAQLKKWNQEAPGITEIGIVGKTQNNTDIPYIRVGKKTGPKVMITSAIHGNEHLCASVAMGVFGKLLDGYMTDPKITELLRTRDIYFVPVVSPESYMKVSRHDMGKDPNRNFNGPNLQEIQSIPSVAAIKDFFQQHKFKAVMSCHNHGKVYFYPWGYQQRPTENDADYKRIFAKMGSVSGYKAEQLLRQSAPPYYGYEVDWYHKHGAMAVVNEIGTRFNATTAEVQAEVKLNLPAFMIFIDEAPIVRK